MRPQKRDAVDEEPTVDVVNKIYHGAKDSNPHDHGPLGRSMGQGRGETVMTDAGGPPAEKPAASEKYTLTLGMAHLYNEGDLHSPRRNGPIRLIRIGGKNMEKVQRFPYERVS